MPPDHSTNTIPWLYISISTSCWTVTYLLVYLYIRRPEYSVRFVSLLHALSTTCLCFYICVIKSPFPLLLSSVGLPNTWWHNFGMTYSLGYFLFDLTWSLYMQTEKPIMLAHHVVSIIGFFLCLKYGVSGCEILATTGGAELSNPFLQWRWLLQQEHKLDTDVGRFVEHMFLLIWFVVRMGIGTLLYAVIIISSNPLIAFKLGANCMFTVSCTFTYGILQYYKKRFGDVFFMQKYFTNELPSFVKTYWNILKFKHF